jgi:hypothetical protein
METTKPKQGPNPEKAIFKLVVFFKNGQTRTFYNFHTSWSPTEKKVIINEQVALNKLENLIKHKFVGQYKTALVYYKPKDQQIIKYTFDNKISQANYTFVYNEPDTSIRFKLVS